jgi:prolipoprotein diacylglyceryltransferase
VSGRFPFYPLLALAGVFLSALVWTLLIRRRSAPADPRLAIVYFAGLAGALVGAQIVYLLAEGWLPPPDGSAAAASAVPWRPWTAGKSVLGALLAGYGSVEAAKRATGYRAATGDLFALAAPLGLLAGRIGCLLQGCCAGRPLESSWYTIRGQDGVSRWPAVPVEMAFQAGFLAFALAARRRGALRGQLFHTYLMAYGAIRFAHEFARDTPRLLGPLSGYHLAALAVLALGWVRDRSRRTAAAAQPAGP